jgi:hypothetical protein
MPAPASPQNTLLQMSQVLFAPTNLNKMQKIMNNPMRNLAQLNLQAMESLTTSFVAAEGNPENMPMALAMFFVERMEDPLRVLNILMGMANTPQEP